MKFKWNQTTVVITGASSGIGAATAKAFAAKGAAVVLGARTGQKLEAIAQEIKQVGGRALAVPMDVTDPAQCRLLMGVAIEQFGQINVLLNNAGIGYLASVEQVQLETARKLMDVNFFGALNCIQAALPFMREQRNAHIINMISMSAKVGLPYSSLYCASKHALLGLSEALRIELHRTRIKVSAILSGMFETPFFENMERDDSFKSVKPENMRQVESLANRIVRLAEHPKAQLVMFPGGRFTTGLGEWFPRVVDWQLKNYMRRIDQHAQDTT